MSLRHYECRRLGGNAHYMETKMSKAELRKRIELKLWLVKLTGNVSYMPTPAEVDQAR